jgi:hypothetical protein
MNPVKGQVLVIFVRLNREHTEHAVICNQIRHFVGSILSHCVAIREMEARYHNVVDSVARGYQPASLHPIIGSDHNGGVNKWIH